MNKNLTGLPLLSTFPIPISSNRTENTIRGAEWYCKNGYQKIVIRYTNLGSVFNGSLGLVLVFPFRWS